MPSPAVTHCIGHRLDGDPIRRSLQRGRQTGGILRPDDVEVQVTGQRCGARPNRTDKSELVERRRPQRVDHPADVGDARGDLGVDLVEQGPGRRPFRNASGGEARLEADRGQGWTETVVQIATQAEPLILASTTTAALERTRSSCSRTACTAGPIC
jgi:hypothetical protein